MKNETVFLLVEDDEVDIMAMKRAFRQHKIANDLVVTQDGMMALEVLNGTHATIPRPSSAIVLLDLNMPRMNGHEFLDAIRQDERLKSLVVFVLTSSAHDSDIQQAYSNHVAGYIVKSDFANGGLTQALELLDHYWRVVELPPLT
ncbi:MAG: response regulator [Litorivicinus sp.]